ncbi:ribosome production factor 2 homolog [Alnus glutinosa]|uniref:ribosome production factor 2 homolog n=1 Tax=Alnus glutinosa TaxID=3517 RepID=UPI002D78E0B0|nr:ribosome production factor 2 homolog [Alnus glutinosa]
MVSYMQVVENLNLVGVDHAYVCTAISSNRVFLSHCGLRLKKSGTKVPRMELEEVGPSMDFVVRRHRLPNDSLRKEAMKTTREQPKKKVENVSKDEIQGKIGKIYMPDQKVGDVALPNIAKGVKRERREAKLKNAENTLFLELLSISLLQYRSTFLVYLIKLPGADRGFECHKLQIRRSLVADALFIVYLIKLPPYIQVPLAFLIHFQVDHRPYFYDESFWCFHVYEVIAMLER